MAIDTWVLFLTTVFFLSATPGPNMLLALGHGLRFGPRRAVATAVGTVLGLMLLMAASVTGLSALLAASETAFSVVKWCGVAYLLYLGVKSWRATPEDVEPAAVAAPGGQWWRLGGQAFMVCVSNPKAIVFLVALFPQFLDPARPMLPQVLVLGASFAVCEAFWIMAYASGGGRLLPMLRTAGAARLVNRLTGGLLIGAGAMLAVARRL